MIEIQFPEESKLLASQIPKSQLQASQIPKTGKVFLDFNIYNVLLISILTYEFVLLISILTDEFRGTSRVSLHFSDGGQSHRLTSSRKSFLARGSSPLMAFPLLSYLEALRR